MNTKVKPRFKTLKAATSLVFGKQWAGRLLPRHLGGPFVRHEQRLIRIMLELDDWAKEYRKTYGKTACADDFLAGCAEEIHAALTAIDNALASLLAEDLTGEQLAIVTKYVVDVQKMWQLDFTEQPPAKELPIITDAETAELIAALDLALAAGTLTW